MLPTLESLILLRGAKQATDLDLSDISEASGIDEAILKSNPSVFADAVVKYFEGKSTDSIDKPKDVIPR